MLAVDLALLAAFAALVAFVAGALGGGYLGRKLEERRRQRLGERNAEAERRLLAERCVACGEPINPADDLFDRGQWWHRRCWRAALDE